MLKLSKLFFHSGDPVVFCDRIEPTDAQRSFLVSCKDAIRDHLRPRIREVTIKVLGMAKAVDPRFRTQGSWAYRTCVQLPYCPPQEMDWDFGVYLPVTVWEENGPPAAMAKAYFVLVENLLKDLCKTKGWTLISGKDTCIRVRVSEWAHIDVPLYAAPEREFDLILEKAARLFAKSGAVAHDAARLGDRTESGELAEQAWEDLDQVVMATRSGEWKQSDPEAVSRWFNDRILEHGEQLRRVCRYVKAWRDFQWPDGDGPSSVAIMIAVAQRFEAVRGRDDLALEASMARLAEVLQGELREPSIDKGAEDFLRRLSGDQKGLAARRAAAVAYGLKQARSLTMPVSDQAVLTLRGHIGDRVPDRKDLIEPDDGADDVRAVPARRVTAPVVLATSAG